MPLVSDEEILRMAAKMRVADPDADPGAFEQMTRMNMLGLLRLLGVMGVTPKSSISDDELRRRVRFALWDSQRIDYLFHGKTFETSTGKLALDKLPSWPGWKDKHSLAFMLNVPEGQPAYDGIQDADKVDKLVLRHFQLSAFTQAENRTGVHVNPPPTIQGALYGIKNEMAGFAARITEQGSDVQFGAYFEPSGGMLIMEVLDVKQAEWPDPSAKEWKLIRSSQETKFGWKAEGDLAPPMRTPKFPIIVVRYAYCEGRPKDGLQFMTHLQDKLGKQPGMTLRKAREELQDRLTRGVEMSPLHLRLWAQILSANSALVDKEYVEEIQSHWSGLTREQVAETRISFVAPCLRLRWRAQEELETGVRPAKVMTCKKCGKDGCKLSCGKCKGVMYCSTDCNKSDWSEHKAVCTFSKRLITAPSSLSSDKFYISARMVHETMLDTGFAVEQELIKQSGCPLDGECPPNEYGDERFMLKLQVPPDYVAGELTQHRGTTVFIVDRRRSLFARTGPGDFAFALQQTGQPIPFHEAGYNKFRILLRMRGIQNQVIYLWARRLGDCFELDLSDIPNQREIIWQ